MGIFNQPFFWILLFIFQIYLLSILSNKIFNILCSFLYKIFKKETTAVYIIGALFLPGTFIHELSHAISATLLGSRVTKFSVWPQIENGGIKMGYAQYIVLDVVRNTIIGISPLLFGIVILYFLIINFFVVNLYLQILFVYLIFQVANSMFLSESDIRDLKFLSLFLTIIISIVLIGDYIYFDFDIINQINFSFLNFINLSFLIYLNIFFIGTLILNLIILGFVFLLEKMHRY
jgi:hypothetical protein